ncbi:hypothetical protein DFH08DRAFT_1014695 [Mycena albidolilacea]|uniref:Uncharacterized protein n=1 Tax=Mycena albidolilacea TaxID=1033008 RepID=A0AAD6ZT51_9AGAR|nr:hypothetical protein DFH08DRAFT_1014695 [Mycena albidolilacea]
MADSLSQSMTIVEHLRTLCATTPDMNAYQPLAASAVEVSNRTADKLACFAVDQTAILINGMPHVPLNPRISESLASFERKLDDIRRHIEQMSQPTLKKNKLISAYKFRRDASRLKTELKGLVHASLRSSGKSSVLAPSRGECILELVSMSVRAAGVICDAPVLNVMKPVIEITTMICDMAKRVKSNREVALALAAHASAVTKCIVERTSTDGEATAHNAEALKALNLVLEDIHSYLTILKTRHGRMTSWVLANQQKDRSAQFATALDKALALFTSTQVLSTKDGVRSHTHTLDALVTTVGRMDNNLTPLVASAVEICASANLIGSTAADSLASFASLVLFEQNWTTSGDILSRFQGEFAREIG